MGEGAPTVPQFRHCMQRIPLALVAIFAIAHPLSAQAHATLPDYMSPPFLPPAATVVTAIRAGRLVDV